MRDMLFSNVTTMMYGKHFGSMYQGSMVGSGAIIFAVWGYVIATMVPDEKVGAQVELNPKLLAFILGEELEEVEFAVGKLCAPDPESRSKEENGARLVRLGQFDYRVVNGAYYMAIKDAEAKRAYNRTRQRTLRSGVKATSVAQGKRNEKRRATAEDQVRRMEYENAEARDGGGGGSALF